MTELPERKPRIKDIVIYSAKNKNNAYIRIKPAMITHVNNNEVCLRVFNFRIPDELVSGCPFSKDYQPGCWSWRE